MPMWLLRNLLYFIKRSNTNPLRKFSDEKLLKLGFEKPQDFQNSIDKFAEWYKCLNMKQS